MNGVDLNEVRETAPVPAVLGDRTAQGAEFIRRCRLRGEIGRLCDATGPENIAGVAVIAGCDVVGAWVAGHGFPPAVNSVGGD